MKFFTTAIVTAAAFVSTPALAADRTVTLAVKNMTCATCAPTVKKSLTQVKGVKRVAVSAKTHTARVVFDDKVTKVSALVKATTNAGYPSRLKS
ncbi:MAG TPA: mercury resistance system periplasmic binding protein MerP [Sphingomicrobium sp.]|nr:mercury resistance system periplasmic binding protein MerP [Sphingomicrobium sp.]